MATWLIVEDNPMDAALCIQALKCKTRTILHANTLGQAKQYWENTKTIDAAILDLKLPDGCSLSFLKTIKQHNSNLPVLMASAFGEIPKVVEAIQLGAIDFIEKPLQNCQLEQMVHLVEKTVLEKQSEPIHHLEKSNNNLIYHSDSPLKHTVELCHLVASKECPIYLRGESGTGKEVLAHYIHEHSGFANGPFIAVNCGAIPELLMESQFFGHTKGAFSGAHQDRQGFFEAANGGTLFLDEVAELPLSLQSKLLRVIQEKEICPLGATKSVHLNFRLISASHKDLKRMVETGQFREDLYYRIHVFPIYIPPLRERSMDILPLVKKFVGASFDSENFPPSAIQAHWPGNIRQLKNACDRYLVYTQLGLGWESALQEDQEGTPIYPTTSHSATPTTSNFSYHRAANPEEILEQLRLHQYNRADTAQALGISRRTLQYRLAKMKAQP